MRGSPAAPARIAVLDRLLRLGAGLLVVWLTWNFQAAPLFYLAGAVLMFTAVYDRCPIWQAISPRLARLFRASP